MAVSCSPVDVPLTAGEKSRRGLYVSWTWLRRADSIAESLGIPSYTISHLRRGLPLPLVVLKYALQLWSTFFLLVRKRPHVVFVTNPPVFAVFPVYVYAKLFRAKYVMDSHSGCFTQRHWQRLSGLQRFFSRRAVFSLVHNKDNAKVFDQWEVPYEVFPSLPPELSVASKPRGGEKPLVVFICSHQDDEPVEEFLAAAETLGVDAAEIVITGKASQETRDRCPAHVRLAGYLSEGDYLDLLVRADLLVALTKNDATLLYGAQEAIALHKPLVLTGTSTLREYFPKGTVFTENAPERLALAMTDALLRREDLTDAMAAFEVDYREEGQRRLARIWERVS